MPTSMATSRRVDVGARAVALSVGASAAGHPRGVEPTQLAAEVVEDPHQGDVPRRDRVGLRGRARRASAAGGEHQGEGEGGWADRSEAGASHPQPSVPEPDP